MDLKDFVDAPEWLPTPENINALPDPLRKYIHDLETNCDPAGMVQENALLKDTVKGLIMKDLSIREGTEKLEAKGGESWSDPISFVEGLDPDKFPFPADPDLKESETGIRYEILIHWEGGAPEHVRQELDRLGFPGSQTKLFICVPQKFAGTAFIVSSSWADPKNNKFPYNLFPNQLIFVSTGRCFEESEKIKIEKSDRIYVFNGSRLIFKAKDFQLWRKSHIMVYRTP